MNSDGVPATRKSEASIAETGETIRIDGEPTRIITPDGDVIIEDDEADDQRTRRVRIIIIVLLIALIAGLVFYFSRQEQEEKFGAVKDAQVPVVSVVTPGKTTVAGDIEATGSIAARRPMPVGAVGEGGRVTRVTVDAGDWVRQGQLLVAIDSSVQQQQIASARGQVAVAQADADLAQANLSRALKLVDRGFISKADVDRLRATRDSARARVRVAAAQLNELRARTARLNVYAPYSGLVLDRMVEVGQTVGGGAALFTIARGGEMEMMAKVDEDSLAQLSVGRPAVVKPVGTDVELSGQIWQLAPVIDQQTREGTARIALSYSSVLRPGGFAKATISAGELVAPILPESVFQNDERGTFVMLVNKENKAVRRDVETGLVTNEGIVVTKGLDGNERVVLRAGGFLSPGDTVKPIQAKRAAAARQSAEEEK